MSYIDRAVMDLIARGQIMGFVPMNAKIADITHPDVLRHELTLAELGIVNSAAVLHVKAIRQAGAGAFLLFPNEGTENVYMIDGANMMVGIINNRLQYRLSNAGDDWDIYCLGYWTRGIVTD